MASPPFPIFLLASTSTFPPFFSHRPSFVRTRVSLSLPDAEHTCLADAHFVASRRTWHVTPPVPYPRFAWLCSNAMRWLLWGAYVDWREAPVSDFSATSLPKMLTITYALSSRAHASIHPSSSVQTSIETSGSAALMVHTRSKDQIRDRPLTQRVTLSRKHDRFQPHRDIHTLRVVNAGRHPHACIWHDPVKTAAKL